MPFGAMYGALFFAGVGIWAALPGAGGITPAARVCLFLLAGSLALGLLRARAWARWGGALVAAALAAWMLLAAPVVGATPIVLLFGSVAAVVLLVVPPTGRQSVPAGAPAPAAIGAPSPRTATLGATGWLAALAGGGLLAAVWWAGAESASTTASLSTRAAADPAVRIAERVRWTDFGSGLERARTEGKPLLVTFVTNWCGYCRKMDRTTWKHPAVVERMDDVVAVRVDAEEARERNGFVGRELAGRYGVTGYPAVLLLDGGGAVIARSGGYQEPRQLLGWLEDSFSRLGRGASLRTTGP